MIAIPQHLFLRIITTAAHCSLTLYNLSRLSGLEPIHIQQSTVDRFKQIYFFYVPLDNIRKLLGTDFLYLLFTKNYKEAKMRFLGFITRDISEVGVYRLT